MAYNDDQNEISLPAGGNSDRRRSTNHLPRYFRTVTNSKFLSSTLDQLIQPGTAEKLNGYFGRKEAKGYSAGDFYIGDVDKNREDYQLEPSAIIKDDLGNVSFYSDYNDYINQLSSLGSDVKDHSVLNRQEYYAWNPMIDWDKFVNFREYYWLPTGPQSIPIFGYSTDIESTYTVKSVDNGENYGFVFTPDGLTQNPELTLYRGIKYKFEIDSPGIPLSFRTTKRTAPKWIGNSTYYPGDVVLFEGGIYSANVEHFSGDSFDSSLWNIDTTFNLTTQVSNQSIEQGTIELTLDNSVPDIIYYMSDQDIYASGTIRVRDIAEAAFLNVESEIIGKKTYKTSSGVNLSNGMKVYFQGEVIPETYASGAWFVEGVGDKIKLISEEELNVPTAFTEDLPVGFDDLGFDNLPYSEAIGYPLNKDYITINRASKDGNLWSKYNRWTHKSVIEASAKANGLQIEIDQSQRATRPIIEFDADLKLFNFGTQRKQNVDLVDDFTKDAFSIIEGSVGYNVDGVDLTNGMRIIFTADPDVLVKGKIFEVQFITVNNQRQITLRETEDSTPIENETVLCKQGEVYTGKMLWFNGTDWVLAQDKTKTNQSPLFDVFDTNGISFSDASTYESTTFAGTKVFSYKQGSGLNDLELGFPISYRSIENVGDIVFQYDYLEDTFRYFANITNVEDVDVKTGFLRKYENISNFESFNGWIKAPELSSQPVIRQYVIDNTRTFYTIDVYNRSALLDDLWIKVYLNNRLLFENTDYTLDSDANDNKIIRLINEPSLDDNLIIKTTSSALKNNNGHYEIPSNLERNPLNNDVFEFTLGEVNDHVGTIVENESLFTGDFPGTSNLRDLGDISKYGRRIVKHSSPLNLSLYHVVNKDANIIKSLKYARREYGKFKRLFLQTAYTLGFSGPIKDHVDNILREMLKDKTNTMPFYFSDMLPYSASKRSTVEIEEVENTFFALSSIFTLDTVSEKAVQIYQNGVQLVHGKDYTFNDQGFAVVTAEKQIGDIIDIYEYETTDGSYCPPTPTKLGLFPKFEPQLIVDDTYLEPRTVIQGHDGSIVMAYNDYRDDLLLELEKRIYNNIKVEYDPTLFDINDFIPGQTRTTGLTKEAIDESMISDFVQWLQLVDEDYTANTAFERTNTFTFNYQGMLDPSGNPVTGYWRNIYKWAYDTDRPHTHPWEMLGFSIKPSWWEDRYGTAPYTKDNLLMWEDLSAGIIRETETSFRINEKYVRPTLMSHIPVDEDGNLVSPILSSYIKSYNSTELDFNFKYGDYSPVETAWRKSSEYPFALLTSLILNQPSKVFASAFDRLRQKRGLTGQLYYNKTNQCIRLEDIIFPNTTLSDVRVFTAGLVNYVFNYFASSVTNSYEKYQEDVKLLNNQIGFKIGGYTTKDKFKLILDSRTPLNKGNVFVPEENYNIFLNKSSPISTVYYSGVLVEKQSYGFVIRGYNTEQPYFYYNKPIVQTNDPLINVGGISQNFVYWDERKTYSKGAIVEYESSYYRVTESHTSGTSFDSGKFSKLPKLPESGGREAYFRKRFKSSATKVPYGTVYKTIQEVVDFLLGYSNYLESLGFVFDYYSPENEFVSDWKTSAKEFMFWSTQNWGAGAVIALSPAAFQLKFISKYAVIDDIYDTFYGYSLLKADGKKLQPENASLTREEPNEFLLRPKATEDGIFAVRLALVQREHVTIIDNKTVFGDIIYDQEPGYRQERIRVLGYRTSDWDGSLNIPGFIFDSAKVTEWQSWTDYAIGDLVKYKEFYYTARNKISGAEVFNANDWVLLEDKPEMGLIPNFEYKTNQFADFYDLDTDNFDLEQQKFAQHLIGYQNRDYLQNIINDDVSQYKFYQGMIADKGTRNALTKLFDVLSSADKDSLEFFEEWAIRVGQYGASAGFEEVEYLLDESKIRLSPQSFELVDRVTGNETDLVYRIRQNEVYLTPEGYTHQPFPATYVLDSYTKNSGYVNPDDVEFVVTDYASILNINFEQCNFGDNIWVGNENLSWNVYTHIRTDLSIESIKSSTGGADLILTGTKIDINPKDIIGVFSTSGITDGFYRVTDIKNNIITISGPTVEDSETILNGNISVLKSSRVSNYEEGADLVQNTKEGINRVWIDESTNGQWQVVDRTGSFNQQQVLVNRDPGNDHSYGSVLAVDGKNTTLAVGSPDYDDGKVYIYTRAGNASSYQLVQVIEPEENLADALQRFGGALEMSADGRYLLVGSPNASNVKTDFLGEYADADDYPSGSIVAYQDSIWKALVEIEGALPNIEFGSFESVPQINVDLNITDADDEEIPVVLTGDYPFDNINTDHFIVKAPRDMYDGSGVGDVLRLKWNDLSYAFQENAVLTATEPFRGQVPYITTSLLTSDHVIAEKIDSILYIENSNTIPLEGQIVETIGGFGTVAYRFADEAKVTIYIKNQNGTFGNIGSLTTSIGEFVGEYITVAPAEQTLNADQKWGGYWRINTDSVYTVSDTNSDLGKGLVYTDIIPKSVVDTDPTLASYTDRYYYNILDYDTALASSLDTRNSQITSLTYEGLPGPNGVSGTFDSRLWVLRAPKDLTDYLNPLLVGPGNSSNPEIDVFYNPLASYLTGTFKDPQDIGLSLSDINKRHTVYDIWDGYIDVQLTETLADTIIEPKVGIIVQDVTNLGTGLVTAYQKFDTEFARVYIKNLSGYFAAGANFGENREIQFLADGSGDPLYDPASGSRVFGQIQQRSLPFDSEGIGRMVVFDNGTNIPLSKPEGAAPTAEYHTILDGEYWFYDEDPTDPVQGIPRLANRPSENNNDWLQIYNIPVSPTGTGSTLVEEGMFSVYERRGVGQFVKISSYIVPERASYNHLGADFKLGKLGDLYRLFVHAAGNPDAPIFPQPGRIYIIKTGNENDYSYFWELGKDKQYTGEFNETRDYYEGDIVYSDYVLYRADTNIAAGPFNINDWIEITEPREYVGYVPNDTGLLVGSDLSSILDQGSINTFGQDYDISQNGEVLAVTTKYGNDKPNLLVIYRNINGSFYRDQTIEAPNNTIEYGYQVSVSTDGRLVAVSAPYDDSFGTDYGSVYVYLQVDGQFVLNQTLKSPMNDRSELFGYTLDFDGNTLIVGSRNGDSFIESTFDQGTTTFDNEFTKYRAYEQDTGVVRVYERLGDYLGYAQTIDFDDSGVLYFGRNALLSKNHIYVGLPSLEYSGSTNRQGVVVDYRKPDNTSIWSVLRSAKQTVNIDKIKRVILYDTSTNDLVQYLDYIDVLQGKIPGPAEQELSFKLYYDPAIYSIGTGVNVDPTNSWGDTNVGQLWWDLTNAKYVNPYQDSVIYSSNNWNVRFSSQNTIDVYEWVESKYLPSEWDNLSGTDQGLSKGITGKSRYSDDAYSTRRIYDTASKTFTTYYYYWVRNKSTIPEVENRKLSGKDVANLIRDPAGEGYRFLAFISPTEFALYNCDGLIRGNDIALSIQYWTIDNQDLNIHNQYQILTEGLETSTPNRDIESKWFDSLVGFDSSNRQVPAPELSVKERYGNLNRPRQGWFVNRSEALKQLVDRTNSVLAKTLIADDKDISDLTLAEDPPSITTNRYDRSIDTLLELQFVGVARASQAELEAVVENGKIVRVIINNGGRGYLTPPTVTIVGTGENAVISTVINSQGTVIDTVIEDSGRYYDNTTRLQVRRYTVLVNSDSTLNGKWALYERDIEAKEWVRVVSQSYDVGLYWEYMDWYESGYSQFTEIDYLIDFSYDLQGLDNSIGDIVKISNVGTGGWLLLEKIDSQVDVDYSVNYKTVGRQNGTIQFKSTLYNAIENLSGFDTTSFDTLLFDSIPSTETRIILETLRDKIFIDELKVEYNNLFFASLRYVFTEQNYVDWAFKTSFIKAKHNVGNLDQKISFQNDNLPSYEEYIKEVKPYKAKIREYLSSYENIDESQSMVTDFDLPPAYDAETDTIKPQVIKVNNNALEIRNANLVTYPNKHWQDNLGFTVVRVEVSDAGAGYISAPVVTISGGGGTGAKAVASLGRGGSISSIEITVPGSGYLSAPIVELNGSVADGGREAKAVAILGDTAIKTIRTAVKFDRVSGQYEFINLDTTETYIASGNRVNFDLEWPMDLRTTRVSVFVNGEEALGGQYTYENILDTSKNYDRYYGQIQFIDPPVANAEIVIQYSKDIALLKAQDRINLAYEPTTEQFGKTLGQLMDGVDYGGVQVRSFDFGGTSGWDSAPWFTQGWDVYDTTFEDEILLQKTVVLTFDAPVEVKSNQILVQANTGATGRVVSSTTNTITMAVDFDDTFEVDNEVWSDDSTPISDDSSSRKPTEVEEKLVLTKALEQDVEYNVYRISYDSNGQPVNNYRVDDPDWDGSTLGTDTNEYAQMLPIQGNGDSEIPFENISFDTGLGTGENTLSIVIRKVTSDGSFIADPDSYDTELSGGDLAYQSARGLNSNEITIDGDGFVTATTSKGPEELVPGQVVDSVDIRVYEKPTGGVPQITSRNYIGNGVTRTFDLGISPVQKENLFVKIGYSIVDPEDYTINYDGKTITFDSIPANGVRISLINIGESAANILDIDTFEGDGETIDFLSNARWVDLAQGYVTVNGVETEVSLIKSDNTYEYPNNIVIRFATPPNAGSNIRMMLVQGTADRVELYSRVNIDTFTLDGSTTTYSLGQAPFSQDPVSSYVLVKVNDKILTPGYSERFIVEENVRDYQLDLTQIPVASVNSYDIEVYLNGRKLEYLQEWTFEGAGLFDSTLTAEAQPGSTVTLERGVADAGDELKVYVLSDGEYRFGYYDSSNTFIRTNDTLYLDSAYNEDDSLTVYQFSNHDSLGIERTSITVSELTELTPGSELYYETRLLEKGLVALRKPARDAEFVWVVKNGDLLSPSIDYSVTENKRYVRLVTQPEEGDEIQVIHFGDQIVTDKFGWRQFKDMLNRTHYKRLDDVYVLAEDLNYYDKSIKVLDATGLPTPDYNPKYPGVVFIEGERIEFFARDGNELLQIRRGTLGTGIKDVYLAGTELMEQGVDSSMPYKDETETINVTAGGYSQGSANYENSEGVTVSSITYNFNNNTAFPVRVPGVYEQICTVKGEGFTDRIEVFVGETQCTARFVSDTEIEFDVPGLPVGAYDLIIINPFTSVPIDTPQTSIVVPGAIEYVQILLPFAPIPNPASATGWYKETTEISVADIVPGRYYILGSVGTTDFTTIGSPNNNAGTEFLATAVGTGTGTVLDFSSIPYEYWEAQDIEVFAAGRRLRKAPISIYNYDAQDSPEGDITLEAEFAVNKNIGAYVRLTEPPKQGTNVSIIRKVGTLWSPEGTPISQADTDVAKFLRSKVSDLPR